MYTTVYVIAALFVAVTLYLSVRLLLRSLATYGGSRIVNCPETEKPVVVEIDVVHAAVTTAVGSPELRLSSCSRWPMKENCGQGCLARLDLATEDCLVRSVLAKWYTDKSCVYCGKHFSEVSWIDHKPALQSPDGLLMEWSKVELAGLTPVLDSYLPVCWDCYIAQTFFNEHPELVVYRPWQRGRSSSAQPD